MLDQWKGRRLMARRVPYAKTGKALIELHEKLLLELERYLVFHALRVAYEHAIQIGPVATGKARWGLNPSVGSPEPLTHQDQPAFPAPGAERLIPLIRRLGRGLHAYLTYHALDSQGIFDYAGIMLEKGWSSQAPFGVLGPTKKFVEQQADVIAREAVADTLREVRHF